MHDIRLIRDDPAEFSARLARRGATFDVNVFLALEAKYRLGRAQIEQQAFSERKQQDEALAMARSAAKERSFANEDDKKKFVSAAVPEFLRGIRRREQSTRANIERSFAPVKHEYDELLAALAFVPNAPLRDVPDGADENDNVLIHQHGTPRAFDFAVREHDAIGPALGMDFETGVAIAGARFTLLRGAAARLNRALGQFMLDALTREHGYEEVAPPVLVRGEALFGTGQLPKFAEDLFRTTDDRWLIPTAEVSLTNIVREKIVSERELPMRFTALTPCFRSEAGAAGRDTRGLIRQHQFDKVEMVSITTPDASPDEHERMTRCAEAMLEALELPYRRMLLCTGDMGFSAAKTYDLEVWLPGQDRYREISSCSTCTDFQARRMNARYRPEGEKNTRFVHTLNGSALAVGRTLVAVIENYQEADGSVTVPAVLQPYLGGATRLAAGD